MGTQQWAWFAQPPPSWAGILEGCVCCIALHNQTASSASATPENVSSPQASFSLVDCRCRCRRCDCYCCCRRRGDHIVLPSAPTPRSLQASAPRVPRLLLSSNLPTASTFRLQPRPRHPAPASQPHHIRLHRFDTYGNPLRVARHIRSANIRHRRSLVWPLRIATFPNDS
jgi:hypothetical protein